MELKPEIELLNSVGLAHNVLYSFSKEIKREFPNLLIRFDVSLCSVDRKSFPGSPIGITWEINLDENGEVFFFELLHESNWRVSSELARPGPETVLEWFDFEFDELTNLLVQLPSLLDMFKQKCRENLENKK